MKLFMCAYIFMACVNLFQAVFHYSTEGLKFASIMYIFIALSWITCGSIILIAMKTLINLKKEVSALFAKTEQAMVTDKTVREVTKDCPKCQEKIFDMLEIRHSEPKEPDEGKQWKDL